MLRQYAFIFNSAICSLAICVVESLAHLQETIYGRHFDDFWLIQCRGFVSQCCWGISVLSFVGLTIDPFRIVIQRKPVLTHSGILQILFVIWMVGVSAACIPLLQIKGMTAPFILHSSKLYSMPCYACTGLPLNNFIVYLNTSGIILVPIFICVLFAIIWRRVGSLSTGTVGFQLRSALMAKAICNRGILNTASLSISFGITACKIIYEHHNERLIDPCLDHFVYMFPLINFTVSPLLNLYIDNRLCTLSKADMFFMYRVQTHKTEVTEITGSVVSPTPNSNWFVTATTTMTSH
ncbi:hypothetical protein HDV02_006501 [Globomyces sp. JEL0801]|nr:hypothetical protein HDV02_006501 [Globomyces sp. JEL0801]